MPWSVQAAPAIALSWSDPSGLPAAVTSANTGTFAFTATGQSTLTCRLDGVDQTTCASPESVIALTDGTHTYAVVANSGLGSQVVLSYTWVVDTLAPDAPTISAPDPRTTSTSALIAVFPGDPGDVITCTVDGSPTACTAPINLNSLTEGGHSVTATATDAAGNTAETHFDWTIDLTGPVATPAAPTALTAPFVVTFDEYVTGVDTASVVLADEAGAPFASTQRCLTAAAAVTDCSAADVRTVQLKASSTLVLGQYYRVQVNPVGSELVTDDLGNVAGTVDDLLRAPTTAGESSLGATFTWRKVADKKAKGGSYFSEHRKGSRASWTFSGTSVGWLTLTGPSYGKADVYIDGKRKMTVNNYAKSVKHGVIRTVKGLTKGTHTIEIRVLGKKGAKAGKGTFVAIDGFKVGDQGHRNAGTDQGGVAEGIEQGGEQRHVRRRRPQGSDDEGQRAWHVTSATRRARPCVRQGWFYVDGKLVKTVDLYAKSTKWGTVATVTGLTDAAHTVLVEALGTKNAKSTGTAVVVDGLSVADARSAAPARLLATRYLT